MKENYLFDNIVVSSFRCMSGWLGAVTRAIYIIFVVKPKFICANLGNGEILQCLRSVAV